MMLRMAALAAAQLALVAGAVAPQLASRVTGEDHLLRVEPVDPVDPFRGAYVTLSYPDLQEPAGRARSRSDEPDDIYLSLVEEDGFWVAGTASGDRPGSGPYLACVDDGREVRCGIESWFVPQDRASALERGLADGGTAVVRIDSRGVGTVVSVDAD